MRLLPWEPVTGCQHTAPRPRGQGRPPSTCPSETPRTPGRVDQLQTTSILLYRTQKYRSIHVLRAGSSHEFVVIKSMWCLVFFSTTTQPPKNKKCDTRKCYPCQYNSMNFAYVVQCSFYILYSSGISVSALAHKSTQLVLFCGTLIYLCETWCQFDHNPPVWGWCREEDWRRRCSTDLVEAEQLHFAADVDAGRTDAEDGLLPQATLSVDGADRHRRGQRRRHRDGDDVQRPDDHLPHLHLRTATHTHTSWTSLTEEIRQGTPYCKDPWDDIDTNDRRGCHSEEIRQYKHNVDV